MPKWNQATQSIIPVFHKLEMLERSNLNLGVSNLTLQENNTTEADSLSSMRNSEIQ